MVGFFKVLISRFIRNLKNLGCTTILLSEMTNPSAYTIEHFISHGVIFLHNFFDPNMNTMTRAIQIAMSFFPKKVKKSDRRKELLKKIYRLGFEVGYHGHFEIGWVSERYRELLEEARKHGLEREAEDYYKKGRGMGQIRKKKRRSYES
ncbi:MAG: ATPase domain-containing protein [Candidatus Syntropharchaeia archaeon]